MQKKKKLTLQLIERIHSDFEYVYRVQVFMIEDEFSFRNLNFRNSEASNFPLLSAGCELEFLGMRYENCVYVFDSKANVCKYQASR